MLTKTRIIHYIAQKIFQHKLGKKIAISDKIAINFFLIHFSLKRKKFRLSKVTEKSVIYSNKTVAINVDVAFPWIAKEIFVDEIYKFRSPFDTGKQYIVLDIGANRGYASLYFASQPWCKKVYAFEIITATAKLAQDNINLNPLLQSKISLYPFGLGNVDGKIQIKYLENQDYLSSWSDDLVKSNADRGDVESAIYKDCDIRQASSMLKEILDHNSCDDIVLKIDVEGAEYDIMQDIADNFPAILPKIKYIFGETHFGFDRFLEIINKHHYRLVWKEENPNGTCLFEIERI